MKSIAFLTLLLAGTTAFAAPPVKAPPTKYSHLHTQSPFTVPPVVEKVEKIDTTFDDWALGGVSEIEGGYMVTLINKKNQGETQVIKPRGTVVSKKDEMEWLNPGAPGSFKVERVTYGKTSWKETTVLVSSGGKTGTMKFDDKQLTPAASAGPGPGQGQGRQPGVPGQPPQIQPGNPNPAVNQPGQQGGQPGSQNAIRPPRQRVLPPAPSGGGQSQSQGQGSDRGRGRNR